MSASRRFEEIDAWQSARKLTQYVDALSAKGSFARDFGLREQMRRSVVSIMSNIAEGFESRTPAMFIEFLGRAKGSASELRAQEHVARDVGHISAPGFKRLLKECELCSGQISRFISYLQSRIKDSVPRRDRSAHEREKLKASE